MSATPDLAGLEQVYRKHVDLVIAGDLKGVLADMDPACLPGVFEGVVVPRGQVEDAVIRSVRVHDGNGVGEAVYSTPEGEIGLRSGWVHDGQTWRADTLSNFDVAP